MPYPGEYKQFWKPDEELPAKWFSITACLLNNISSFDGSVDVVYTVRGIYLKVRKQAEDMQPLHPWSIVFDKWPNPTKYKLYGGNVVTKEGGCLFVTAPAGESWADLATDWMDVPTANTLWYVETSIADSGSPIVTAQLKSTTDAVDGLSVWTHAGSSGPVTIKLPVAQISIVGGIPVPFCWQSGDLILDAGCNVNDDATSLLTDGTTEFLVLTEQGAAGSTAAAKVRKLTIQVDHGHVIRWVWGTPATAIGYTADTVIRPTGQLRTQDGKLQYEYYTEEIENGVILRRSATTSWGDTGVTTCVHT